MRSRTSRILANQVVRRAPRDAEPLTLREHVALVVVTLLFAAAVAQYLRGAL